MKCIEDEIPFEVPDSWAWSRFSSAFVVNPRNSLPDDTEVSFIPMLLIQEGYANNHTSEEKIWGKVKSGFTHFAENDIGVAKITPCFENKKSVVFKNLKNGFGAGTTELHIIRSINGSIYPEYVLWNIKTDAFITNGVNAFSGAVGQKRIGKNFIEKSLIPIAPTSEQKRIVECISIAFERIDEIDIAKEAFKLDIDVIKSKILDFAIRGNLVPQDPNDEPASVLLDRIRAEKEELIKEGKIKRDKKESVIFKGEDNSYYRLTSDNKRNIIDIPFDIPDNWEWCNLSMIGSTNIGLTYKPADIVADGTMVLRSSNIINGKIDLSDLVKVNSTIRENQYIQENDILICARNGSKALVGKCAIFENVNEKASFGAFMAVYRSRCFRYVYYFLNSEFFRNTFSNDDSKQINQLTQDMIKNTAIPLPPLAEQKRIVKAIETIFAQLDEISNAIA
ncbi:restriction endonuclease subunit S [Peptoniphilus asaccharolyticus]